MVRLALPGLKVPVRKNAAVHEHAVFPCAQLRTCTCTHMVACTAGPCLFGHSSPLQCCRQAQLTGHPERMGSMDRCASHGLAASPASPTLARVLSGNADAQRLYQVWQSAEAGSSAALPPSCVPVHECESAAHQRRQRLCSNLCADTSSDDDQELAAFRQWRSRYSGKTNRRPDHAVGHARVTCVDLCARASAGCSQRCSRGKLSCSLSSQRLHRRRQAAMRKPDADCDIESLAHTCELADSGRAQELQGSSCPRCHAGRRTHAKYVAMQSSGGTASSVPLGVPPASACLLERSLEHSASTHTAPSGSGARFFARKKFVAVASWLWALNLADG